MRSTYKSLISKIRHNNQKTEPTAWGKERWQTEWQEGSFAALALNFAYKASLALVIATYVMYAAALILITLYDR